MKSFKNSNLPKLVAFFIVAMILTCTVAYAAGGFYRPDNNVTDDNGKTEGNQMSSGESDKNNTEDDDVPTIKPIPEYFHYITGLEITADERYRKPICFTFDTSAPQYGISDSYLLFEVPTEFGKTRYLAYSDNALSIGKIGALAPTRGYISNLASYFGGILVSNGNDANINNDSFSVTDGHLNLSEHIGYHYTELKNYSYTNGDLLSALIKNTKTSTVKIESNTLPYIHNEYNKAPIKGNEVAEYVQIIYDKENTTEFLYSKEKQEYTLYKNGSIQTDMLNSKSCEFDNVVILFTDSATYETSDYTESVFDTAGSGRGVYLSQGTSIEISWTVTTEGRLVFLKEDGEQLIINRGSTFISIIKSSLSKDLIIR